MFEERKIWKYVCKSQAEGNPYDPSTAGLVLQCGLLFLIVRIAGNNYTIILIITLKGWILSKRDGICLAIQ